MIEIAVCSNDPVKTENTRRTWNQVLAGKTPYRLHIIEGAKSMAGGYREAERLMDKKSECWIFCHNDVAPLSQTFYERLCRHLTEVEVVGGCGSNRLAGVRWLDAGPGWIFGQVGNLMREQPGKWLNPSTGQPEDKTIPAHLGLAVFSVHRRLQKGCCLLDGFFICERPGVLKWNDQIYGPGFHHYDTTATFDAYLEGHSIGVASDFNLLHTSIGGYGLPEYQSGIPIFLKRYERWLPPPQPFQRNGYSCGGEIHTDLLSLVDAMERNVANCE